MEKLLVTQALDERDLLVKKINDKIEGACFVDVIKNNEDRVQNERVNKEDFERAAKAMYQQINDLIARHQRIDAAIVASNAATKIETPFGTFTVAEAISLRNRLRCRTGVLNGFEERLQAKMTMQYEQATKFVENANNKLSTQAENMRLSILGRDSKSKDDKPLAVVDAYVSENTCSIVDPLHIVEEAKAIKEKQSVLLKELDTKIKVSNATTFIEF